MIGRQHSQNIAHDDTLADGGWSLVEMLIALVLLALLSAMLFKALASARNGLDTFRLQAREAGLDAVQIHLRHTLAGAWPLRRGGAKGDAPIIEATNSSIEFISNYSPQGQHGGLYVVALELVNSKTSGAFDLIEKRTLYREPPQTGGREPLRSSIRTKLISGIVSFKIRYFGTLDDERLPRWFDGWSDSVRLPELISLEIVFPANDKRVMPKIVVGVPASR